MHIDMTMRPSSAAARAPDAVTLMLAIHNLFPRAEVEAAIDAMIEAMDAADGDADSEDADADQCLAGDDDPTCCGWACDPEDKEPWHVPPHWPANDQRTDIGTVGAA